MSREKRTPYRVAGDYSEEFWWNWIPMHERGEEEANGYMKELSARIDRMTARYNEGMEGRHEVEALEELGELILQARWEHKLNPAQLSRVAGVDEKSLLFAEEGLLSPEELIKDGLLLRICEVLSLNLYDLDQMQLNGG